MIRIITLKQQKFSPTDQAPDLPILNKFAVRSNPDPAEIGICPHPVLSIPVRAREVCMGWNLDPVSCYLQ